jgi:hypothetical protein
MRRIVIGTGQLAGGGGLADAMEELADSIREDEIDAEREASVVTLEMTVEEALTLATFLEFPWPNITRSWLTLKTEVAATLRATMLLAKRRRQIDAHIRREAFE